MRISSCELQVIWLIAQAANWEIEAVPPKAGSEYTRNIDEDFLKRLFDVFYNDTDLVAYSVEMLPYRDGMLTFTHTLYEVCKYFINYRFAFMLSKINCRRKRLLHYALTTRFRRRSISLTFSLAQYGLR